MKRFRERRIEKVTGIKISRVCVCVWGGGGGVVSLPVRESGFAVADECYCFAHTQGGGVK